MAEELNAPLIAQRIKDLFAESDLTDREIAIKLGTSEAAIYKWKRGSSVPSGARLVNLCSVFKVSIDYLMGISDERNPSMMGKAEE